MKKNNRRRKTPKWVDNLYWNTMVTVEGELIDRVNIWHFNYFVPETIVPLLEDFLDVAEFNTQKIPSENIPIPEGRVTEKDFQSMIAGINLLVRYNKEGGLKYMGRDIDFERGDVVMEVSNALHMFVNLLPYLNNRYFTLSQERYEDAPNGRHCDFKELCNLDKTIARRIFPTLNGFSYFSIFVPLNFKKRWSFQEVTTSGKGFRRSVYDEWKATLEKMVKAWYWLIERKPASNQDMLVLNQDSLEEIPESISEGLHLFAEYLPEMQND